MGEGDYGTGRSALTIFDAFAVLNVYVPHGGRDGSRMTGKLAFLRDLLAFIAAWQGPPLIIAGDFNVARQTIDVARASRNLHSTMFSSTEREAFETVIGDTHVDAFRRCNPEAVEYSWWPYAFSARERNVGWRIDYVLTPKPLAEHLTAAVMHRDFKGSDHCPVEATFLIPQPLNNIPVSDRASAVRE